MVMTTTVGADGKSREMLSIDRQTLIMWLATIDASRLKSERARHVVTRYQLECASALDSYFSKGFAVTPSAAEQIISDPDTFIRVLTEMKSQRARADRLALENSELRPKAMFADSVANSDQLMLIRDLAHVMCQHGLKIGQNRLFARLREDGYLERHRNEPTQRSIELGVLRVVEHAHTRPDGTVFVTRTPKVTGKGQAYFVARYCGEAA